MGEAELALVREVYADWGRGDYSRADYLHPEFELVFAPGFLEEGTYRGARAAWRGWRDWMDQWSSWTYAIARTSELDDRRIVVYIDIDAVAKTTGLELAFKTANLCELEGGLLRRVQIYPHREDMLRELGIDPDA